MKITEINPTVQFEVSFGRNVGVWHLWILNPNCALAVTYTVEPGDSKPVDSKL